MHNYTLSNFWVRNRWFWTLLVVAVLPLTGWHWHLQESLQFSLQSPSRIYLEGSSNITEFSCLATQMDSFFRISILSLDNGNTFTIESSPFRLLVKELDCGRDLMNQDLYEALKADQYPHISLQLKEATIPPGEEISDKWLPVSLLLELEVGGQKRLQKILLYIREISPGLFRLKGSCPLEMTDFSIEPPTALLGMLQVEDRIEIHFDLRGKRTYE